MSTTVLTKPLAPVGEGPAVETVLGTNHIEDLRGGEDGEELVVIGLLDLLQLQLHLIVLLHQFLAAGIVGGLDTALLPHLSEDGPLLLLHLTVDGEELGSLIGSEVGLLGDELLHLGLKLLRREFLGRGVLGLVGQRDQHTRQEEHHAD